MDLSLPLWLLTMASVLTLFVLYLAAYARRLLLAWVLLLSSIASVEFLIAPSSPNENLGFVKFLLLLPLGLGSLLLLGLLTKEQRDKYARYIHAYVNIAVVGNILAMLATPSGGTVRGVLSRLVCIALVVWLLQEMRKHRFQTTAFVDGLFLFRAVPLSWILCHACYRIALLSLPVFDSPNYLLLEPLSLGSMLILARWHRWQFPVHHYYGYADTLVICTLTAVSRWIELPRAHLSSRLLELWYPTNWDFVFVPVQLLVLGIVWRKILANSRSRANEPHL